MAESYSVKAILSAQDKNFSSIMKSCQGYANNLKTTLTGGLGFGAMAAIGGKAMSLVTNSVSDLSKETIETSDSMYKLQAAMRFSGYSEAEIQRIAGATGTLKTYADKTVFSLQDVMSTFGSLSANGIKDADKLTEAIGNAVAVFGGGAKEYSSVALAISQAMAAGALHAQDWNQIINASPQLAGGLRKELIKLNPTLGNDFKGAMEKGAITADMLGQAINNIGMTDMAKEAATSVTTFEGAMGNLEASAVSGMMKLYDTFAKPKVIDAINGMTGKVEAGFDKLSVGIPKAIELISPYWNVLKTDAKEVGTAFGEAAGAIIDEVQELTGAFGKKESVDNFSESMGTATGALTTFADFLKDHDKEVAKAITLVGAGLTVVGAAVLIAAAGVLLLAAGTLALGAGLTVAGAGLLLMGAAFPAVSSGALATVGALTALTALSLGLAAGMGASAVVVVAFGAAMAGGAVGTLAMVAALKSVNSSMKSIASNAKSAQSSLTSMRSSVNVVNAGLDALGSKAKSAINALISQFTNAEGKAKSSGNAVGNNFNSGVSSGMSRAVSTARSMSASTVSAMRSAGSGSYSCGVYIGAGLANGMASQVGRVRSVAAQLAAAAEAAIRAKAQIHSPSKVTDKLGGYFGEGWVNGISDRVTDAKKAAWKLVDIPDLVPVPEIGAGLRIGIEDLNDDYDYTRNETYTIYVPVEVDGRQVAKATAKYTKEEIEQQQKRDLRKKGMR